MANVIASVLVVSYVGCSSDNGGGFSRFHNAWISTKFHPSLTKARPSSNTLHHGQQWHVLYTSLTLDHYYDPRILSSQGFQSVSCTSFVRYLSLLFTQFQTNAVHSHVGKERSFGILMAMSRSLGATVILTVPSMEHLPSVISSRPAITKSC